MVRCTLTAFGCISRHRKPELSWPPLLLARRPDSRRKTPGQAKQDIGAWLTPLDNVVFFISNGVDMADVEIMANGSSHIPISDLRFFSAEAFRCLLKTIPISRDFGV
ncbi:MAG: hypothetical protein IIB56_13600 [Planctomycetes bacterium]|nr:hypothetical protein [Planctomycetota bacterium]